MVKVILLTKNMAHVTCYNIKQFCTVSQRREYLTIYILTTEYTMDEAYTKFLSKRTYI